MATFKRLAEAFYTGVEDDPLLRPLYVEETLEAPAERLGLFLAQFFGGPPQYSLQRGHPMLRARHLPFRIGKPERDAWIVHMLAAIDETGIQEPARSEMREYFERASTFLINQ
ncbi:MAG: globin [Dehalococcoidia bacterium]|nr:globin [Dehalococcoidia bacterium]